MSWYSEIDVALVRLDAAGDRGLVQRRAQMPPSDCPVAARRRRRLRRLGEYKDGKFRRYGLSLKQRELVEYLRDCGPAGAPKDLLYADIYAPEDIQPYRIDHDIDQCNLFLQGLGYWVKSGRDGLNTRYIEKIPVLEEQRLPVLLEEYGLIPEKKGYAKRRILRHLTDAGMSGCTRAELVDAAYGDDPEGGPLDAISCVNVHLYEIKRILEPDYRIWRVGFGRLRLQSLIVRPVFRGHVVRVCGHSA